MPVERMICTTVSTSVFSFRTEIERAAEIELNNQLLFAKRLSMS